MLYYCSLFTTIKKNIYIIYAMFHVTVLKKFSTLQTLKEQNICYLSTPIFILYSWIFILDFELCKDQVISSYLDYYGHLNAILSLTISFFPKMCNFLKLTMLLLIVSSYLTNISNKYFWVENLIWNHEIFLT